VIDCGASFMFDRVHKLGLIRNYADNLTANLDIEALRG